MSNLRKTPIHNLEILRKRLLYQSQHRGMREMDFLLGRFSQKYIHLMTIEELNQFEELLTFSDHDLYGFFFEKKTLPRKYISPLLRKLMEFAHKNSEGS